MLIAPVYGSREVVLGIRVKPNTITASTRLQQEGDEGIQHLFTIRGWVLLQTVVVLMLDHISRIEGIATLSVLLLYQVEIPVNCEMCVRRCTEVTSRRIRGHTSREIDQCASLVAPVLSSSSTLDIVLLLRFRHRQCCHHCHRHDVDVLVPPPNHLPMQAPPPWPSLDLFH